MPRPTCSAEYRMAEDAQAEIIRKGSAADANTLADRTGHMTGCLQIADVTALALAARGVINLHELAKREMASRGLDDDGRWIGFDKARAFWAGR